MIERLRFLYLTTLLESVQCGKLLETTPEGHGTVFE